MVYKYIIRLLVVALWVVAIYGFLMLPKLLQHDHTDPKSIRVYTWANRIDESMLREFERHSGIKVYLNYYESSEELLTKLETMASADCDLLIVSDYIVSPMIEAGLIKKLDKARCGLTTKIYTEFLHPYFDTKNDYTLPLYWDVFGIGFNTDVVSAEQISLALIFDKDRVIGDEISMSDDPREVIFLGASYLGIPLHHFSHKNLERIQELLCQQKDWVGAYTDTQQGYFLASDTFDVAVSDRETICRWMQTNDGIGFAIPETGSMLRLDSIALGAQTQKDEAIYQFLQFLFLSEVLLHHAQKFCILPTTKEAFKSLDQKYIGVQGLYPGSQLFKKLTLFDVGLSQKQINDFWIRFKAA